MATWTPKTIVKTLATGGEHEREDAQAGAGKLGGEALRELRSLLIEAIRAPDQAQRMSTHDLYWARAWLMSTLARVANGDAVAREKVDEYLTEPGLDDGGWIRYWTLAGLVAAGEDLDQIAADMLRRRSEKDFVKGLCWAIRARNGSSADLKHLRDGLRGDSIEDQWAVLRGLRIVPIADLVGDIRKITREKTYEADSYGAVAALGAVPPDWPQASGAALSLANVLSENRRYTEWSELRAKALEGLGNLRVTQQAPALLAEMCDDNPAIVRAAARSLEKVLGTETAVDRIVEAVLGAPDRAVEYAGALRWMCDQSGVVEALESVRVAGRDDRAQTAQTLLTELGGAAAFQKLRARTSFVEQYSSILERAEAKVRTLFDKSLAEARRGFRLASWMDVTIFVLGTVLIVSSATWAMISEGNLDNWLGAGVSAGLGTVGVLYSLFVAKPRRRVQEAADHLMYMKIVFLGYLRQLHQIDQAFSRRMLEDRSLSTDETRDYSEIVDITMTSAIKRLLLKDVEPPPNRDDLAELKDLHETDRFDSAVADRAEGLELSGVG